MKEPFRFKSEQQQQAEQEQLQHAAQAAGQEFRTVEELLRHDALHTPVPPRIEVRLRESVAAAQPQTGKGWLRRWFGS